MGFGGPEREGKENSEELGGGVKRVWRWVGGVDISGRSQTQREKEKRLDLKNLSQKEKDTLAGAREKKKRGFYKKEKKTIRKQIQK